MQRSYPLLMFVVMMLTGWACRRSQPDVHFTAPAVPLHVDSFPMGGVALNGYPHPWFSNAYYEIHGQRLFCILEMHNNRLVMAKQVDTGFQLVAVLDLKPWLGKSVREVQTIIWKNNVLLYHRRKTWLAVFAIQKNFQLGRPKGYQVKGAIGFDGSGGIMGQSDSTGFYVGTGYVRPWYKGGNPPLLQHIVWRKSSGQWHAETVPLPYSDKQEKHLVRQCDGAFLISRNGFYWTDHSSSRLMFYHPDSGHIKTVHIDMEGQPGFRDFRPERGGNMGYVRNHFRDNPWNAGLAETDSSIILFRTLPDKRSSEQRMIFYVRLDKQTLRPTHSGELPAGCSIITFYARKDSFFLRDPYRRLGYRFAP